MVVNRENIEGAVEEFAREVFEDISRAQAGIFSHEFYTQKLLDWAMKDEEFKTSLFRFVDVLPALRNSRAVVAHGQEYFAPLRDRFPSFLNWGLLVNPSSVSAKFIARAVRRQVRAVGEKFIVGETARDAIRTLRRIRRKGAAFTIDLLGEATVSEQEAEVYLNRYLELLQILSIETPTWPEHHPLVPDHVGEKSPVNISVKLSALYSQARPLNTERSVRLLTERLCAILSRAREMGAYVYVDMEDTALTAITIDTVKAALSTAEFRDYERCGIVLQAYLRRSRHDVEELIAWVRERGTPLGVRLVKGAYWDSETILARQRRWPLPVWEEKSSTDANYEALALRLLENAPLIYPAFGSHNIRSLSFAALAAEALGVPRTGFEFQVLYGMAEPIQAAFVKRGFLVRQYAPVGDLITGMGYLVRRLLENTSNEGFLRLGYHGHGSMAELLAPPRMESAETATAHLSFSPRENFENAPLSDFSSKKVREVFQKRIEALRRECEERPVEVYPVLRGVPIRTGKTLRVRAVEDRDLVLAEVLLGDSALVGRAVSDLHEYFPVWRDTPVEERAEVLFRAAELLERRRAELSALMVLEEGKQWGEADADVAEAIDFCNYYALEAKRLGVRRVMGDTPGEENFYFYEPRGVAVVISPWNFPLAIPCGMFAAALVTGNTVLLKPAEQSNVVAARLFEVFLEARMPPPAAAFVPGIGEEVGPVLVTHPSVATIAFTGSRDVGLKIFADAALSSPRGEEVKRVIAEMGGKNAIIVDEDADLDEAVKAVISSAFGYQGQKCSACSRVIVVGGAYDRFLERLAEATKSIIVGRASDPSTLVGPVIDDEAYDRIQNTIASARGRCRVVAEGPAPEDGLSLRNFIRPIVFADIPPNDELLREEIFGPVLAVLRAEGFDEAVRIALDSAYALTGAVFSRSPANIERAIRDFRVGNLYINRGCTGALVYRQPFGGHRMSGVGSKAGGPDYLLQFVIPRSVSENTMRRGFAPSVERSEPT